MVSGEFIHESFILLLLMHNPTPFLVLLLETISMITLIVFALGIAYRHSAGELARQVPVAVLMAGACVLTQTFPMRLDDAVFIDSRAVLIAGAGAFLGPFVTAVCIIASIATRIFIGGLGMWAGITTTLVAGAVGLAFSRSSDNRHDHMGPRTVGLALLINISALPPFFFLPELWRIPFYVKIGVPLAINNIVGILTFGMLLSREFQLQKATAMLKDQARTDPLTGLANRRALEQSLHDMAQRHSAISLIYIDADHFKRINDKYGHAAGDHVLQKIAARLRDHCPKNAALARIGGEEFVAIIGDCDSRQALRHANRLREAVGSRPLETPAGPMPLTISLGVYTALTDESFDQMLHAADQALYAAKEGGRNRVVPYRPDLIPAPETGAAQATPPALIAAAR